VNNKDDCLKLHHVGYLTKLTDDAWNNKHKKIVVKTSHLTKNFWLYRYAAFSELAAPNQCINQYSVSFPAQ
jgi:hypothetical protein